MTATDWKALSRALTDALKLQTAPLAITFSQEAPSGVRPFDAPVPQPLPAGRVEEVVGRLKARREANAAEDARRIGR